MKREIRIKINGSFVRIRLNANWSASRQKNRHRQNRARLENDLQTKLRGAQGARASVSHTRHLGGFALARGPVGFDLEPASRRVSHRVFQRLGDFEERALLPEALHLWVAKEAAWKSLSDLDQPATITSVVLKNIRRRRLKKSTRFSFEFTSRSGREGCGLILVDAQTVMAVAIPNLRASK